MRVEKQVYTIAEVAELTGFSRQTVTRLFEDEPGVLKIERPETMHKRPYRSIRIPCGVYARVVERLRVR
jgi:predicted transcriptional regulator